MKNAVLQCRTDALSMFAAALVHHIQQAAPLIVWLESQSAEERPEGVEVSVAASFKETFQVNLEIVLPTGHYVAFEQAQATPVTQQAPLSWPSCQQALHELMRHIATPLSRGEGTIKICSPTQKRKQDDGRRTAILVVIVGCIARMFFRHSRHVEQRLYHSCLMRLIFLTRDRTIEIVAIRQRVFVESGCVRIFQRFVAESAQERLDPDLARARIRCAIAERR